jgi:hypothetical protein
MLLVVDLPQIRGKMFISSWVSYWFPGSTSSIFTGNSSPRTISFQYH